MAGGVSIARDNEEAEMETIRHIPRHRRDVGNSYAPSRFMGAAT
jgi:hypothetical protein